jgi:6-phosphofructokinase 1
MLQKKFAVLTCGGVCPGLNDVIRSITLRSFQRGVTDVYGVPFGFRGLTDSSKPHIHLSPPVVETIHHTGGTYLGTSRVKLDPAIALDILKERLYSTVFVIGGNGGNAAASVLQSHITVKGLPIQVIALPKSIDNDIDLIDKCFGFDTAVNEACKVLQVARNEADAVPYGISIVKLMGRDSGFIAWGASRKLKDGVDICLIPEYPRDMSSILSNISDVLRTKGSCVVCVAEGHHIPAELIHKRIIQQRGTMYVKYIDPSYMVRGCTTTPEDHEFCTLLGEAAVDAAMDGYTGITVATKNGKIHYFDTKQVVHKTKRVDVSDIILNE